MKYDAYEIRLVAEYVDFDGQHWCEPAMISGTNTIEDIEEHPQFYALFWALYGHVPGHGVEHIADGGREFANIADLYSKITGHEAPSEATDHLNLKP